MELNTQIKKYRTELHLSQEELAEKVYVTRQTISNWENNKNYPDIHSLLLLSTVFQISLDQLIKGDIDIMREEMKETDRQQFYHYGKILTILLVVTIISFVPLVVFLKAYGLILSCILFIVTFMLSLKVEKLKKENNMQTYKEIIAFTEGKRLDEIEKHQEYGKGPYQKFLLMVGSGLITLIICVVLFWILKPFL